MTSRRLLIFQEARNPQNPSELVYVPVNKLGLPICGPGPDLPSILELPLRILRAFTEIFNQPKFKGWCVYPRFTLALPALRACLCMVNVLCDTDSDWVGPSSPQDHTMIPLKKGNTTPLCWSRCAMLPCRIRVI